MGSCEGLVLVIRAVIALAIRCLWPTCQNTARLGAIAMPKGVLAALIATADPDKHQEASCHRARHASAIPAHHVRGVEGSARWMGSCKHNCWHWLHCQLPKGQVSLTDLKLTHPGVIPNRDRIAAPMRLAFWIRFETVMTSGQIFTGRIKNSLDFSRCV